jgi:hypothetical protein
MGMWIGQASSTPQWTFIASNTTGNFNSLPAYDEYMFIIDGYSAGGIDSALQCNGDGGTNYSYSQGKTTGFTAVASQTSMLLGSCGANAMVVGVVYCAGKSPPVAGGKIAFVSCAASGNATTTFAAGTWTAGNAVQLTSTNGFFNFDSGKVQVFGRSRT